MADTAMPLVRKLDPETAHRAGVLLEKYHLAPVDHSFYPELRTNIMGLEFRQCVGLAAGFDKQAEAINEIFKSGLSFLEVGGITPKPQPGNPSPRMFRLYEDEGIINRLDSKVAIGQGWKGKSTELGVGACTSCAKFNVKGCPPTAKAIYDTLSDLLF